MKSSKYKLDNILIKDLLDAVEYDDPSIIDKSIKEDDWLEILNSYEDLFCGKRDKTFDLQRKIEKLRLKYQVVQSCCEGLLFDYNQDYVDILSENNYKIDENKDYLEEIDRIQKKSNSILIRIERYVREMPKDTEEKASNIDKIIIAYCSIIGVSSRPNETTVTEFSAYKELAEEKIKNIESDGK